jgi:hypothetical protein
MSKPNRELAQFTAEVNKWRTGADNMARLYEDAKRQLAEANAKLNTEMAEHTREVLRNGVLEAQLAEALKQTAALKVQLSEEYRDWLKDQCNEGCDYGMRMYMDAKAQLAEANAQIGHLQEDLYNNVRADNAKAFGLFAERDAAIQRAEAAEARAEAMRAALVKVEAYLASEESPLYSLWENGDICAYDDNPVDTWQGVLEELRNPSIDPAILGYGTEWIAVDVYREILAALADKGDGAED